MTSDRSFSTRRCEDRRPVDEDTDFYLFDCQDLARVLAVRLHDESCRGLGVTCHGHRSPSIGDVFLLNGLLHYIVRWIQRLADGRCRLGLEVVLIG